MRKGSITVFFALILSIIIVLICTATESVKMMCARTQIANGADVGMYSLFAQYDRDLLERYHLFYLDAAYGTGTLQMSEAYRTVKAYMEPILHQNYLDLSIASGGITSFVLATDCGGRPFFNQAVDHVRDGLNHSEIQFLAKKVLEDSKEAAYWQEEGKQIEGYHFLEAYEEEMARAGNESAQAEAELPRPEEIRAETVVENPIENPVENPINTIREIQNRGILDLVFADSSILSKQEADVSQFLSSRYLEQGMGILYPAATQSSVREKVLFQEYLMQNLGMYLQPSGSALKYQMEYILGKSHSDKENLERTAQRLLWIREGVNFTFLYADPQRRAQSAALAAAIASGFRVAPSVEVIERALLFCWAFGESVLEVKALFDGNQVPKIKNPQNWILPLENLSNLPIELSVQQPGGEESGMAYGHYLRALLYLEPESEQVMGSMDLIEADIRSQPGRQNFRLDCCLEAMEAAVDVEVNQTRSYTVLHRYGYY